MNVILPSRVVVALSGASGTRYGRRLVQVLARAGVAVDLIVSRAAQQVLEQEEGIRVGQPPDPVALLADLGGAAGGEIVAYDVDDLAAPCASGSAAPRPMAIVPCSMATLGAVAAGAGRNLLHRAAEVTLKEHRPLIVAPREAPLSLIHLRNLVALAEAGAVVLPCMPGFSHRPDTLASLVDGMVMRLAEHLGVRLDLVPRWGSNRVVQLLG
jgi:4-hydroxy-3-polyprenylbenzoate decarboxylase